MNTLASHITQIHEDLKLVRSTSFPGTYDPLSLLRIPGRRLAEKLAKINLMVAPTEAEKLELDLAAVNVLHERKYLEYARTCDLQRTICKRALVLSVNHSSSKFITMFRDTSTSTQRVKVTGVIDGIFVVGSLVPSR